jgi:hypothetical protein
MFYAEKPISVIDAIISLIPADVASMGLKPMI